ncbi:hypothetical protein SLEP1_g21357 [Rubroshorea leprosula]|uniref:Putative plant transposon protein domain-containing protein n=1 Tax=Rubroshorea leprosula TaxID=152421 RepID=A0AAV5J5N9_9ROSI|nr:hypothetical protein SLEP1_g21357 [Rubroshorea leprosula]
MSGRRRKAEQSLEDSGESIDTKQVFQPDHPRNFVSRNAIEAYNKLGNRKVIYGFRVVLDDICKGGLHIREMLDAMGWTELVSRKVKVYPQLIKIFYANLSDSEDGGYRTTVLKKTFEFDAETINDVLQLRNEGAIELNAFTEESAKKFIMGDEYNEGQTLTIHHLNLENRLMFWIYNHIILPRQGSFGKFSGPDCVWFAYILDQKRINLGHHIMRQMMYYRGRSTLALVYGTLITLLMENAGVDLRGMESRDLHSHELLNESSLSKMGYVFSARTNSWEMKQKRRRGGQDDEGEGFDDEEHAEETEEAAKLDDHIRDCQMAAPIGPRGTRGDPSTAGTSSG